jgi:hypothetical protein
MRRTLLFSILVICALFPQVAKAEVSEPTLTYEQCVKLLQNSDPALKKRFQMAWKQTEHQPTQRQDLIKSLKAAKDGQNLLQSAITMGKYALTGTTGALVGGLIGRSAASFGPLTGAIGGAVVAAGATWLISHFSSKESSSTQSISSRGLDLTMDMMGVPRVSASQLTARDLNFDTLENN